MKYLFTRKNLKWISNSGDIKSFSTKIERDNFINEELMNEGEDYKALLEATVDTVPIDLNPVNNNVQMLSNPYKTNLVIFMNEFTGEITFHHIDDTNKYEQEQLTIYTLTKSLWLSNVGVIESMNNFRLVKGHSSIQNYANYDYDNGSYKINDISQPVKTNGETPNSFFIITEQIANGEPGIRIGRNATDATERPFRVYLAPVDPIDVPNANLPDQIIINYGNSIVGEQSPSASPPYIKDGNEIDTNFDLQESDTLKIRYSTISGRDAPIGYGNDWNYNETTIKLSDFWNKERLFYFGYKINISNYGEDRSDLVDNINETVDLFRATDNLLNDDWQRYGQLVKIKYDSNSKLLTIKDASYSDYANRTNNSFKLKRYNQSEWSSSDPSFQWEWCKESISDFDLNQFAINTITLTSRESEQWTSSQLIEYLNSGGATKVLSNKEINYDFRISGLGGGNFGEYDNISTVEIEANGQNFSLQRLDYYYYENTEPNNTYEYTKDFSSDTRIPLLTGNQLFRLSIENVIDFEIPQEFILPTSTGYKFKFIHKVDISPNEQQERIEFINEDNFNLGSTENIWDNNRDALIPSNDLALYKSNDPVASKMEILKPIANPLTYIRPISGLGQGIGVLVNRQNMKRKPEQIKGGGDIYSNLYFNKFKNRFIIKNIEYLGVEWLSTVLDIYRNGIQYNSAPIISSYEAIKRPIFNFIQVDNFIEANTKYELSRAEIDAYDEALQIGVRVWNNDKFKQYESDISGNGDN